ncbi:MAG: hypothetical protein ISP49_11720 [Reyranella sp.]|nr:hypothetical protein [Reyranella sp.]MBL6652254.1 hypothetical protein [Reyranella sp.]
MAGHLSNLELEILRKLVNGESVTVSSSFRLRLEMAGVIRDEARGIVVTTKGLQLAKQKPAALTDPASSPGTYVLDKRGRRLPHQRKSIF